MFESLADPVRRGILAALHDHGGPLSCHDVASRFDISWQGISRHLRILTAAGLVGCDVRRNERAYTRNRRGLRHAAGGWIGRVATEGTRDEDGRLVFELED